jgi:hypothetical protein
MTYPLPHFYARGDPVVRRRGSSPGLRSLAVLKAVDEYEELIADRRVSSGPKSGNWIVSRVVAGFTIFLLLVLCLFILAWFAGRCG